MTAIPMHRAGIGLRAEHYQDLLDQPPDIGWIEVHSENFFAGGGKPQYYLDQARTLFPVSLHGVGLSLGSADPLNRVPLQRLKTLAQRIGPGFISEHLSWSSSGGHYLNDLLPLPYTEEALAIFATNVAIAQETLGHRLLIENPSSYLQFEHSTIPEWELLVEVAHRSGCALLLDVNNVYVSAVNHGFDAKAYLDAIPPRLVREMHLAGHTRKRIGSVPLLIDSHDRPVSEEVWQLFEHAARRFPNVPVLIERDSNLPPLGELVEEARRAQRILETRDALAA